MGTVVWARVVTVQAGCGGRSSTSFGILLAGCQVMSDSAIPWTVAQQAALSMGFPRQEYASGLPFLSPGDLPNSRIKPASPTLAGGFFTHEPSRKMHRKTQEQCRFLRGEVNICSMKAFPNEIPLESAPFPSQHLQNHLAK